ncbi:NADH dehydrogenase subunit N (ubiquinone) [Halosimplex carlsbadense 2-9-1]|uniref:NADH dehydrogenase subunit N (Ubiquinone) n=1 Tax=Halosimplex carlsbadense 2-9-1 TaxID=797114 RepID=M0CFC7_9EURY|nr:NADH-quinone oxidoreductase subunit N [Halosimplex carlsbadense]ELZ20574.1 NADH dehydrogenase subunit N (ubiquinone) [Halosimplex carlsbadense 2-9-1]
MVVDIAGFQVADWVALAPAIALGVTAMLLFVLDSIEPQPGTSSNAVLAGVSTVGALVSFLVAGYFLVLGVGQPRGTGAIDLYGGALIVDGMSLFFIVIVGSVTALVTLASYDYLQGQEYQAEYYGLVIMAATGMSLMASANSLATVFVSLELASLPSFALVAFLKKNRGSVEGGLKYFLVGALSSSVLAYGISLVYAATGSLQLEAVAEALTTGSAIPAGVLGVGVIMMLLGFAYKTASVPFHFWAPEAYEGAPAPVSAFLSSASKAAGFVVAFRVFLTAFPEVGGLAGGDPMVDWVTAVTVLAVVTMTVGNFAAATQEKVKRMLAYSSVGHAGYVLIGLAALSGPDQGLVLGASMMHLLVYGFMNTGAFLFLALTEYWGVGRTFQDFNGLSKQAPLACAAMTIFLFSLAGLPVGGGFISKLYLLLGTVNAGAWLLAASLIVNSALSLFYYSRVVKAMWIEEPEGDFDLGGYPSSLYAAVVIAAFVTFALLPAFGLLSPSAFDAASVLFG